MVQLLRVELVYHIFRKKNFGIGLIFIAYSAKFSRCIIFAVFADLSHTAKIKLTKCFLNFAHRFMICDGSLQTD